MTTRPPNPLSANEPWDLVASGYAAEATPIMLPFAQRAAELAKLDAKSVVIDVATGPGTLALLIAPGVKRVDAVDFSSAMLEQLRRAIAEQGVVNVRTFVGDGQALEFGEARYDAAFSMFGLMFFPDRLRGFREILRVLKPGGKAVVSSWAPIDESPLMSLMFGAIRAADPSRPAPQKDMLSLENSQLFREEMERAGFSDVVIHEHEATYDRGPAEEFWERMARSSAPLVLLRRRLGEEVWAEQAKLAREYLVRQLADPSIVLRTKAYLGFGRKPG
jgi:ubiquinone/menaquinone biosynthesis C-methylase UbiE